MEKTAKKTTEEKIVWFDEFRVRSQKTQKRNPYTGTLQTITTGWQIIEKLHPKKIEPHVALDLNSFAIGEGHDQSGLYLVPMGEKNVGDIIPYKEWADQHGVNAAEDLNQILA